MRGSGILLHISSLPNNYGIGKLGKEAYAFVDFLKKAKQKYWQILPVSPTSYGDSPYQSFSVYAGNPYFISFEQLNLDGLLSKEEYAQVNWGDNKNVVDYGLLYEKIFDVLSLAFDRFKPNESYEKFIQENKHWVFDYGLFMALKFAHGGKAWYEWEDDLRLCKPKAIENAKKKYAEDIEFWVFLQYEYFKQWTALKEYAHLKGISIIGDMPIYVALDSVDVWLSPELFLLDEDKKPIEVAGCPPDDFSKKGQLWGNPLYNWETMKQQNYEWWVNRIAFSAKIYDTVRIDHFRGFESYYCIPFGNTDAVEGCWRKGPDYELFKTVKEKLGKVNIIAEDLGFITKPVEKLLKKCGYPGMKVLEFAFDNPKNSYLPHNYQNSNNVVYTGTHDNETLTGWIKSQNRKTLAFCRKYLGVKRNKDILWAMIKLAFSSCSDTAIVQMQDLLELDNSARMNIPSTLGGNWVWRANENDFSDKLALALADLTVLYARD